MDLTHCKEIRLSAPPGWTFAPPPAQKPRPPILIGGNGRLLLALAAREADIVGFSGLTFRKGGAAPPDLYSSLLGDGVRVLTRTMKKITGIAGAAGTQLRDRSRSVKWRVLEIARAARAKGRQSGDLRPRCAPASSTVQLEH